MSRKNSKSKRNEEVDENLRVSKRTPKSTPKTTPKSKNSKNREQESPITLSDIDEDSGSSPAVSGSRRKLTNRRKS